MSQGLFVDRRQRSVRICMTTHIPIYLANDFIAEKQSNGQGYYLQMQADAELTGFLKYLAAESGKIIRPYFRSKISVEQKADNSPVTIADRKTEERLRDLIMKQFPGHGIIGEEFGETNPGAEYRWVLDPIDGTKSFISGALSFGTLIALVHNGQSIIGAFNQPILNELLIGDGSTTRLNDSIVKVRQCESLSDAVLLTTDHLHFERYQRREPFEELIRKVKMYRNWGDCYGYYLLSTGFADVMIDPIMNLWDTAALVPIVRGADGTITDYHGSDPMKGGSIVAAVPGIHAEVILILNSGK